MTPIPLAHRHQLAQCQFLRWRQAVIRWLANVTTVAEAREAVAAGADVIIAQGVEAGGEPLPDVPSPEIRFSGLI